jgi:hypothetical protein
MRFSKCLSLDASVDMFQFRHVTITWNSHINFWKQSLNDAKRRSDTENCP